MTNTKPGLAMLAPQSPVIGHTNAGPVFRAAGGRGRGGGIDFIVGDDDGEDPDFDDEDEDDEDDEDDDPRGRSRWQDDKDERQRDDEDWQPLTREAQESLEEALKRANRESMNRRRVGKAMDRFGITDATSFEDFLRSRGINPETGDRDDADDDTGFEVDTRDEGAADSKPKAATVTKAQYEREKLRAEQRGHSRAEAKYKDAVTLVSAESALRAAGWAGNDINLALKLIDPDGVDVSMDSGELTIEGLEEQVAAIKDEFPSWFRPTSRDRNVNRRRESAGARSVDGGDRPRPTARPLTWQDRIDRQIRGGR